MNTKLLDTFLSEDGDIHARRKLLEAIRDEKASGAAIVRKFTFNRFNVSLDFAANEVALEDDLTVGQEGEYRLSVEKFEKALQERKTEDGQA